MSFLLLGIYLERITPTSDRLDGDRILPGRNATHQGAVAGSPAPRISQVTLHERHVRCLDRRSSVLDRHSHLVVRLSRQPVGNRPHFDQVPTGIDASN